jgi:formiminoglutamate deiminase
MSERIVAAADTAGIGLTLLPVLYRQGGFLGKEPTPGQRRFLNTRESYARLMETRVPGGAIGIAPHSLRALALDDLKWAADAWRGKLSHIHVSEQTREVDECLAAHRKRPIDLLCDTVEVDQHWCLVHATHADANEIGRIARTKAVAGLCPITEANLGDGIFLAKAYREYRGSFGVGSDSQIEINAPGELRQLEYSQRLSHRARNVLSSGNDKSTGRALYEGALSGGAQALSRNAGAIDVGRIADIVVLDDSHPSLAHLSGDRWLDSYIFAAPKGAVRDVLVSGRHVVRDGQHATRSRIETTYKRVLSQLGEL